MLSSLLSGYDRAETIFLVNGFSSGFPLHFLGPHQASSIPPNHGSALSRPEVVTDLICKELHAGRVAGPFDFPPLLMFRSSPLSLVAKHTVGKFRLIHDLSFPRGSSVNDYIPDQYAAVSYHNIDDAITHILHLGKGCFLAKSDIRGAFRLIPIRPQDHHLLGFTWKSKYYYDKTLPMGCRSSCQLFTRFSEAIAWILTSTFAVERIVFVLDDFLFLATSEHACNADLESFRTMSTLIQLPLAEEKTTQATTCLQFLGITLDTLNMEARLPQDKLDKCNDAISEALAKEKITLRSLQRLIGLLNFACLAIRPGRVFLRRLINLTCGIRHPNYRVRVTKPIREDLCMWREFLSTYNGRSMFIDTVLAGPTTISLQSDAAGGAGFGAILDTHWFYGGWPQALQSANICVLELYPIVVAVEIWARKLADRAVIFHCDNAAVVSVLNAQTSRHNEMLRLLRRLVLTTLRFNILFKAVHVPGICNDAADALSRFQVQEFRRLHRDADLQPTEVPSALLPAALLQH